MAPNLNQPKKQAKKVTTTTTYTTPAQKKRGRKRGRNRPGGRVSGLNSLGQRYLTSLMFPETMKARVPDVCSIPTSMVTATFDTTLATNAAGISGLRLQIAGNLNNSTYLLEELATTTDAAFTYVAGALFPANTAFAGAFAASRLVSASVQCEFVGSTLNDQGSIVVSSVAGTRSWVETLPGSVNAVLSSRDNIRNNIRDGLYLRWKPVDDTNDDFTSSALPLTLWFPVIHVTGAVPSTNVLRVRVTLNYEAIPTADTFNFQETETSPVDPTSYERVRNIISQASSMDTWTSAAKYVLGGSAGSRIAEMSAISATLGIGAAIIGNAYSSRAAQYGGSRLRLDQVD
jgi:hypothetical protein